MISPNLFILVYDLPIGKGGGGREEEGRGRHGKGREKRGKEGIKVGERETEGGREAAILFRDLEMTKEVRIYPKHFQVFALG